MMIPQILIVEDEQRVADLLKVGIEEHGYEVMVAYDGMMGLQLFNKYDFKLIISDIILPKLDGFDLCKEIRTKNKHVPILMLTALGTTDDKLEGFDVGADDYMVKPFDLRELVARMKVLLKRNSSQIDENEGKAVDIVYADLQINPNLHECKRGGVAIKLTPKEYNLLKYMMLHSDRIIPRTEIAEKVWGTHFDTGTNFIDVYINYLRKKIDRSFPVKLIHTKPGIGFVLTDKHVL